jgi:hypothetical protein
MKNFAQYLVETKQTFDYRIKIAGDVTAEQMNQLEKSMAQFDVIKMSEKKSTPVMKTLPDFPAFENERLTHMDVSFNYPATEIGMRQICELLGMDPNRMLMQPREYAEKLDQERKGYEDQPESVLADIDYPEPNAEQKELSDDYSAAPDEHRIVVQNEYKSDFTIAGGKTPAAKTTSDFPMNNESPMSKQNEIPEVKSFAR